MGRFRLFNINQIFIIGLIVFGIMIAESKLKFIFSIAGAIGPYSRLAVILVVRTWAIWGRSKRIGYVLLAACIVGVVPVLVIEHIFLSFPPRFPTRSSYGLRVSLTASRTGDPRVRSRAFNLIWIRPHANLQMLPDIGQPDNCDQFCDHHHIRDVYVLILLYCAYPDKLTITSRSCVNPHEGISTMYFSRSLLFYHTVVVITHQIESLGISFVNMVLLLISPVRYPTKLSSCLN